MPSPAYVRIYSTPSVAKLRPLVSILRFQDPSIRDGFSFHSRGHVWVLGIYMHTQLILDIFADPVWFKKTWEARPSHCTQKARDPRPPPSHADELFELRCGDAQSSGEKEEGGECIPGAPRLSGGE